MIRTYLDSGVLIAAFRGQEHERKVNAGRPGPRVPHRPFVEMETVLHAAREDRKVQRDFYEEFIAAGEWFSDVDRIVETARQEIVRINISAIDACHLATASLLGADEFITAESPKRAIFRTTLVQVKSLLA